MHMTGDDIGATLAVEMTANCFANRGHHHVGDCSIEDMIGVDLMRLEMMRQS